MKYRKKPIVIEAFLLGVDEPPEWYYDAVDSGHIICIWTHTTPYKPLQCEIKTLEGKMLANAGVDYIIKGVAGELYPCKKDIFEKTYEAV